MTTLLEAFGQDCIQNSTNHILLEKEVNNFIDMVNYYPINLMRIDAYVRLKYFPRLLSTPLRRKLHQNFKKTWKFLKHLLHFHS